MNEEEAPTKCAKKKAGPGPEKRRSQVALWKIVLPLVVHQQENPPVMNGERFIGELKVKNLLDDFCWWVLDTDKSLGNNILKKF